MTSKRKTIGIDLDDVLSKSVEGFAEFSNRRWGGNHNVDDYTEEWEVFWDVPLEEAVRRSVEFHQSGATSEYVPIDQARTVLEHLALNYDLLVITSRRIVLKPETDVWLETHFPGLFRGIHHAGMWDTDHDFAHKLKQTKAEIARELGVDYLIDDQPKHCIAAADAGITGLLFGEYAWSKAPDLPKNVVCVKDWSAVQAYFENQA